MNLPNCITLARLVLVALFACFASLAPAADLVNNPHPMAYILALAAFVVAAISDFFDGYLARKLKLETNFGRLIDPLADKILVCAGFIYLSVLNLCPVWVTVVIMAREFLVTGIRQLALEKQRVIAADKLGKLKTIFQLTFCIAGLVWLTNQGLNAVPLWNWITWLANPDGLIGPVSLFHISLWGSVILTCYSGFSYTWNNRDLFGKKS